jgi:hypothetical protein
MTASPNLKNKEKITGRLAKIWQDHLYGARKASNCMAIRESTTTHESRLGGVVVTVLATGPKGCGFEHSQGDGFLRAIQNPQHTFLRMVIKAGGPIS